MYNAGLGNHRSSGSSSDSAGSNHIESQSHHLNSIISSARAERRSSTETDVETSQTSVDRPVAIKQENVETLMVGAGFVDSTTLLHPSSPSSKVSQTLSPMSQVKEEGDSSPEAPSKMISLFSSLFVFILHQTAGWERRYSVIFASLAYLCRLFGGMFFICVIFFFVKFLSTRIYSLLLAWSSFD